MSVRSRSFRPSPDALDEAIAVLGLILALGLAYFA